MEPSRTADFESSAEAREVWQNDNNITTILDPNSLKDFLGQQNKPWINNPLYFKQVKMSNLALLKLVMDASYHECTTGSDIFRLKDEGSRRIKDVAGLLIGKIFGNVIIVLDAVALPVEDTETSADFHSKLLHYFQTQKKLGGLENVIGWYRTCISGVLETASDVETQMRIQELMEPSIAVVIDSLSVIDIYKVHIRAFRTFPESYKRPILKPYRINFATEMRSRPATPAELAKIAELTKHLKKRYSLNITFFKFSLTNHVFQELWENYWARLVSMWINPRSKKVSVVGADTVDNKENERGRPMYAVDVRYKFTKQYSSAREALTGLYARLVEDAGSSKSLIRTPTRTGFYVTLTKEQVKKLADNECVHEVRPIIPFVFEEDRLLRYLDEA